MPAEAEDAAFVRLSSSFRWREPAETIALAQRLMPALGISRVTDITRMDRLGLPVFASVRPRSKTLRVHAGKGMRPIEAHVGALMEAIEFAVAEPQRSDWIQEYRSVDEIMARLDDGLDFVDFVPAVGVAVSAEQILPVVACEDLRCRETALLPAELVFVPLDLEPSSRLFGPATNGLASGNTLEEATLHALLEVLEYDAMAMRKARDDSWWVEPRHFPAGLGAMAHSWRELGIQLAVRQIANDFDLPCFVAVLHEPGSTSVNLAGGSGVHLDPAIALARAICEAAQSRLSLIHGGRDDITHFYAKYTAVTASSRTEAEARIVAGLFDTTRRAVPADFPRWIGSLRASPAELLVDLLEHLARRGFRSVFRHRYAVDLGGLHVVKVIVPKCEHIERSHRRIGPRLLARILGHA